MMNTFHNTEIVVVGVTSCFFREKRLCQNFTNRWVVCESTFTLLHSSRRVEQRKVSLLGWWRRETFLFSADGEEKHFSSPPPVEKRNIYLSSQRVEKTKDQTRLNFYLTISISIRGVPLIEFHFNKRRASYRKAANTTRIYFEKRLSQTVRWIRLCDRWWCQQGKERHTYKQELLPKWCSPPPLKRTNF